MCKICLIGLLACVLVSGCGIKLSRMTDAQKAERLATERSRLQELINPVAKTRSHIVISEILLDFAGGAIRDNDLVAMRSLLEQYTNAITDARDTIMNSDRDAERNPDGYKDLELTLRTQIRRLHEMNRSLNVEDRQPVEAALSRATSARDDMIKKFFPQSVDQPASLSISEREPQSELYLPRRSTSFGDAARGRIRPSVDERGHIRISEVGTVE